MTEDKTGGIIRPKKRVNNFVMLDKTFIDDERLSWKAKGMLTYLFSKPDDWQVWANDLAKRSADGIKSVYSGLNELISFGYVVRERERDKTGKFTDTVYMVYEIPVEVEKDDPVSQDVLLENQDTDKPNVPLRNAEVRNAEKGRHTNSDLTNIDLTNISTTTTTIGECGEELTIGDNDLKIPNEQTGVIDPDFKEVLSVYEREFGRMFNGFDYDSVVEIFDLVGKELALEALKRVVDIGDRNFNLIKKGFVYRWRDKGIRTIYELHQEDKKYKEKSRFKEQKQNPKPKTDDYNSFYLEDN